MSVVCSARVPVGWSCEGGVIQSGEGPIPILTPRWAEEVPAPGRCRLALSGKELFGLGGVLLLVEGEHRRDKTRGGLAVPANSGCPTGTVSTRQGIRLSITFLPLAGSAENEELLLSAPEKILEATLLPEVQRTVGASSAPLPAARSRHCRGPCLASTAQWPRSCAGGNWRGCGARCWPVANGSCG